MMKILFISHDASRTGAPLVLLNLITWIEQKGLNVNINVLLLKSGPLVDDFKLISDKLYIYNDIEKPEKFIEIFIKRLKNKLGIKKENVTYQESFYDSVSSNNYDLIYANTIVSIPAAINIKRRTPKAKLISHIHELNAIIKEKLPNFGFLIPQVDHFIAASNLVKSCLTQNYVVPKNKITRVYECSQTNINSTEKRNSSNFVIGGSGTVHWRKGSDLFVQVARYINTNFAEKSIEFCWVGYISEKERIIIEEDLRKLNLTNVNFIGEVDNPYDYYKDFDVFLMTSREDPFPLVCIEVGQLGKPIICFKNATGTEEVINKGGGFIVPYLCIEAMVDKIIFYEENRAILKQHGAINKKLFSKFTPEIICPQLYEVITNSVSSDKN